MGREVGLKPERVGGGQTSGRMRTKDAVDVVRFLVEIHKESICQSTLAIFAADDQLSHPTNVLIVTSPSTGENSGSKTSINQCPIGAIESYDLWGTSSFARLMGLVCELD
jgi:hypothetical protein